MRFRASTAAIAVLLLFAFVAAATANGQSEPQRVCPGKVRFSGASGIASEIKVRAIGCPRAKALVRSGIESEHGFKCRTFDQPRGLKSYCRKERGDGVVVRVSFLGSRGIVTRGQRP